ncbi:hypothetical protein IWX90DRAFT_485216 [Phyllosticta citrichinensis]|uniref:Uncharacterized protein n=1 Tax=Phyllosticta citrichinensis TaxID=1130410 RepID=A0ABR1Y184_9PEZI
MAPPIRKLWDETRNSRIDKRINTKRLIRNTHQKRKRRDKTQHISPGAPSTIPLCFTETQHRRLFTPYPCDVCRRDRSAYSAEWTASTAGPATPAVPLDDTFSLSDACPQLGGAHGYVDLLKGTEIALAHWPHFERALAEAGVVAAWLTTRDRLVAYVLWEAMMAPEWPGLGFAPGVAKGGGSLLFLDMRDPLRRPIEVHFFDFLRVLQDRMAERERHKAKRGEEDEEDEANPGEEEEEQENGEATQEEGEAAQHEEDEGNEGQETQENDDARPPSSLSAHSKASEDSYMDFLSTPGPPFDPVWQRNAWCRHSGLLDLGNPYRKPEYREALDAQWAVNAPVVALVERRHAERVQWERDVALAEARDKEKGKGRPVEVEPEEEDDDDSDELYYAAVEDDDSDDSDDSDSDVGSGCSMRHGAQYWSNAIIGLFGNEQALLLEGDDEANRSRRGSIVQAFLSSLHCLGGGDDL